jgi:hypothetical protein
MYFPWSELQTEVNRGVQAAVQHEEERGKYMDVCGLTDFNAEGLEKYRPGCRIDTSAFVGKVSGSRPGCP